MRLTRHGKQRTRERLGVPKRAVERLVEKALTEGKRHSDFAGSFRRYLDGQFLKHRTANNMRVYSGHLFIFDSDTLVTAWLLPGKFRKIAERAADKDGA